MTRLVLALLLAAPCASMKMKAAGPEDFEMPNCLKLRYNQLGQYDYQKTCRVYHSFMGYHPETGQQQFAPEMYGFEDTEFILDGISETLLWKVRADNSWGSGFAFETNDGTTLDERGVDCDKRTSTGQMIPGFLLTCPHGAVWQAEHNYNMTQEHMAFLKDKKKEMKKGIANARKVMKAVATDNLKDQRGALVDAKDQMEYAKKMMEKGKGKRGDVKSKRETDKK